jgi:hypothetical protein
MRAQDDAEERTPSIGAMTTRSARSRAGNGANGRDEGKLQGHYLAWLTRRCSQFPVVDMVLCTARLKRADKTVMGNDHHKHKLICIKLLS